MWVLFHFTVVLYWSAQVRQKWLQTENTHPHPYRAGKSVTYTGGLQTQYIFCVFLEVWCCE